MPRANPSAPPLRLVFWELTARCNLRCRHCRRLETPGPEGTDELDTPAALALVDQVAETGRPILVLSGGEPLLRDDVFAIARRGTERGLTVALATNGTLVDDGCAARLAEAGVARVAVSVDGADTPTHDAFRGIPGALDGALAGLRRLRARGLNVQLNCTIARHNLGQREALYELALREGVAALHFFVLVPVGCGLELAARERLSAEQVEDFLRWLAGKAQASPVHLKATCAPQYFRVRRQMGGGRAPLSLEGRGAGGQGAEPLSLPRGGGEQRQHPSPYPLPPQFEISNLRSRPGEGEQRQPLTLPSPPGGGGEKELEAETRGCLAGTGICFVSHRGEVFPCGYLPLKAGDARVQRLCDIWEHSPVFAALRDGRNLRGKCAACEFRAVCFGCRARAYGASGDVWAEDPYCAYQPLAPAAARKT
jgi:radical SAM protein with 4Fe4S-binding SPASM domain